MNLTRRIKDAWTDPIRRRNSISRIVESYVPSFIVWFAATQSLWSFLYAAGIVLGEFLLYEFVLERMGWSGWYWERGPRDGERFIKP